MADDIIRALIALVVEDRLRRDLFALSKDPLPYRKLNYTLPGHAQCTLYEADDTLADHLASYGYTVERQPVQVQAYRCDASKPKAQQYSPPLPEDPWYTAHNLNARKPGSTHPEEIVAVLAHKDSQSWVDSPGANDNAVGTVAVLEIARILSAVSLPRTLWILFCNEEHSPWTSVAAAQGARARGENVIAAFNLDGLGAKAPADAGRKTNVTVYTAPEGRRLADLMAEVNEAYAIGLEQSSFARQTPGDDDGSFIKAGYPAAIGSIGSYPYGDPNYHRETDVPELVDLPNVRMAVQVSLAAVVRVLQGGPPA